MLPLIGITCGTSALDTNAKNPQDRLNHAYCRAIGEAGGIPVILPNHGTPENLDEMLGRLDGLLLSGGYDVNPCLFREEMLNDTVEVDGQRDDSEVPLIHKAIESQIPMLAICRGIQILNVALGGTLMQDIPAQFDTTLQHAQKEARGVLTHDIRINEGSRLEEIVGAPVMDVNSFHHQALKQIGEGLVVTAYAPDGIVEAIERPQSPFLVGVQFHPEEMIGSSEGARRLFAAFIQASSKA
jgi:putative glutamine amidotransferase